MKIKFSVDIDWINEDGRIDDLIKEEIVNRTADAIKADQEETIKREVSDRAVVRVDEFMEKTLTGFIDREIVLTDRYGDVLTRYENVIEMIKEKFDRFFDEEVDKYGKPVQGCHHGKSYKRLHYLIDERVQAQAEHFTKNLIAEINKKIEVSLKEEVKNRLSASILDRIDVDGMVTSALKKN
jgi:hypothetical protein